MSDFGFDFRGTGGFVSDPANCQGVLTATTYPTTAGGVTFGWEAGAVSSADRSNSVDARVAGIAYVFNGTIDFRVDLPATGSWDVRLALGDEAGGGGHTHQKCLVLDTSSTLITCSKTANLADDHFIDATNVERTSAADWVTNNAASTQTFSTTICRWRVGDAAGGDYSTGAHFRVTTSAAADTLFAQAWM